jgi:acetyltransferase-like isoleucine patch superfamily enzyme
MYKPIVSTNIRLRYPELFTIGEGSIIDDFCYISTQVEIGRFCHIAASCTIAGGPTHKFVLGDYSGVASGVRIYCTSDQYSSDIISVIPSEFEIEKESIEGDVIFDRLTGVGANTLIMPNNYIPEGTAIGALSFVPPRFNFKPWIIYGGNPLRPLAPRDRATVLRQYDTAERKRSQLGLSGN